MKTTITIEVDIDGLANIDDALLAAYWTAAQASPAPYTDRHAGELADSLGHEIIRRWLASAPALMYEHRLEMHYWSVLQQHGTWTGPGETWQPRQADVAACGAEGGAA